MRAWLKEVSLRWRVWKARARLRVLIDEQGSFELRAEEARAARASIEREIARLRRSIVAYRRGTA